MSHPYRTTLPVVRDIDCTPMSVCAWCVHYKRWAYVRDDKGVLKGLSFACIRNRVLEYDLSPITSTRRFLPLKATEENANGDCPHYHPTLFTRLAWWRRAWRPR